MIDTLEFVLVVWISARMSRTILSFCRFANMPLINFSKRWLVRNAAKPR